MNDNDRVFLHGRPYVYRGAKFEVDTCNKEGCYWTSFDYLPGFRTVVFRGKPNILIAEIQKDDRDYTSIAQMVSNDLNVDTLDHVFNELNTKFGEYLNTLENQLRDIGKVLNNRWDFSPSNKAGEKI